MEMIAGGMVAQGECERLFFEKSLYVRGLIKNFLIVCCILSLKYFFCVVCTISNVRIDLKVTPMLNLCLVRE